MTRRMTVIVLLCLLVGLPALLRWLLTNPVLVASKTVPAPRADAARLELPWFHR